MKTTMLILVALLGVAPAAQAQPGVYAQRGRIQYLAHDLAEAAHHVHESAEAYSHHYDDDRALKALHKLDRQARHFHQEVERYRQDPYHTEKDFRKLQRAFRQAQYAMHHLHTYGRVYDDFYRVEVLMDRLTFFFGSHRRYGDSGHYRGYGHYGGSRYYEDYDHHRDDEYDQRYYRKKNGRRRR